MSASATGAASAYDYLHSLIRSQTASGTSDDPMAALFAAFFPTDATGASSATADRASVEGSRGAAAFSPDMIAAMLTLQQDGAAVDPLTARATAVFGEFDADRDGTISKAEFETGFGAGADQAKVDGLFTALDADGDGTVASSELTAAAQASRARHRHTHGDRGTGAGDALLEMMAAIQGTGDTGDTGASGAAGTVSMIKYASITTMMVRATAALSIGGGASASGWGTGSSTGSYDSTLLAQMFQSQTRMLFGLSGSDQTLFDSSMLPTNMLKLLA